MPRRGGAALFGAGMFKFIKRAICAAAFAAICFAAFGAYCYVRVDSFHSTEDVSKIGARGGCALLLGTSSRLAGGAPNPFYIARIDSAARLYKSGAVSRIIASGDNRDKYYNEPARMKRDLALAGVPESAVVEDPLGLRTYDSVARCRDVFGVSNPVIVSQDSHCRRALYIADSLGMDASALAAPTPPQPSFRIYNSTREFFARMLAVADANLFKGRVDVGRILGEIRVFLVRRGILGG